jgi:hypothetical protein
MEYGGVKTDQGAADEGSGDGEWAATRFPISNLTDQADLAGSVPQCTARRALGGRASECSSILGSWSAHRTGADGRFRDGHWRSTSRCA